MTEDRAQAPDDRVAPPPAPAPASGVLARLEALGTLALGWLQRDPRRALATGAFVLALLLGLGWTLAGGRTDLATAPVREGPFRVSITEAGTLQALRSMTYASSIQSNQAKITALAPEGKLVAKGDLLVLFDAAPFEEEIRRNQALLAQAEAELAKAREDLKLQGLQNREELMAATLRVEKSDLELKDVQQGKGLVKEEEATQAVTNAERELQKAETSLADLRPCWRRASSPAPSSNAPSSRSRVRARTSSWRAAARMLSSALAARSSSARRAPTRSRAARHCASSRVPRPTGSRRSRPRSRRRRAGSRRPRRGSSSPSSSSRAARCGPRCPASWSTRTCSSAPSRGSPRWATRFGPTSR